MFSKFFIRNSGFAGRTMISIINFINLFMLAFAHHQIARSWGSPAWHLESSNPWANQVVPGPESGPGLTDQPLQWQDSPALNQWQEDAAASLPYPHQNHNGHSHYAQLYAQSQPQMNSFGQPGFSPFGTPFHSVRSGDLIRTLKFTTVLNYLDEAAKAMAKHVNSLRYETVVQEAIAKVEKNPLISALSIKNRISAAKSQLAGIINLIKGKQSECDEPISYQCDTTLDQAMKSEEAASTLQTQASFLQALTESLELFNREYLSEVARVANTHGAAQFLLDAEDFLKPLVLAGSEARKIGLQIKLLLPRRRQNQNNRLDDHLNRLDNTLRYLRNRNHHDDH